MSLKNKNTKSKFAIAVISVLGLLAMLAPAAHAKRVYYHASQLLGHPYLLDTHLGFRYAAKQFDVDVRSMGPQGWDPLGQAEAIEQAIAKKPDGIITSLWEPGSIPAIKRAMAQGIPVIAIESTVSDSGVMTFIGLDNYQAGADTAKELIRVGGRNGRLVVSGNWGASNTDAKFQGLMDYLKKNSEWELVGRIDDKANTTDAIEASKAMFNTYKNLDGIVGLDSSTGSGFCLAAEELDIDIREMAVVVHDREEPVLECIEAGVIDSTVINKTALDAYMAIQLLEAYHDQKTGMANTPISENNKEVGIVAMPDFIYMGTEVIDESNVKHFMHKNVPQYK